MNPTLLLMIDLLLALGMTMRLTRLVTGDDIGLWFFRGPAAMWAIRKEPNADGWRAKLQSGLSCPYCVGFWIGAGVLLSLWLAGGPGEAWEPWRWVAGALMMNYVAAHIGSRLGDVDD